MACFLKHAGNQKNTQIVPKSAWSRAEYQRYSRGWPIRRAEHVQSSSRVHDPALTRWARTGSPYPSRAACCTDGSARADMPEFCAVLRSTQVTS
eukprot:1426306-Prymnesium_polylepis.1